MFSAAAFVGSIREGRRATQSMPANGKTIHEIIARRVDELKACNTWRRVELTARQIRKIVVAEMREDPRWAKNRPRTSYASR